MPDHDPTVLAALSAYRQAIAATTEAERTVRVQRYLPSLQDALVLAEDEERLAGRRYLAARDASVASQVTCSEVGPGVADFVGD